jgi:hypothetical protein
VFVSKDLEWFHGYGLFFHWIGLVLHRLDPGLHSDGFWSFPDIDGSGFGIVGYRYGLKTDRLFNDIGLISKQYWTLIWKSLHRFSTFQRTAYKE